MKTIRRYLYSEIFSSISFVTLGFLALFFFFDFVEQLRWINANSAYQIPHALLYVALLIPSRLYELLPITVLIGTIFVMASLAQSSEYTILRTSGLGPWLALKTLLFLGALFVIVTFAIGDYIAPVSDRAATLLQARYQGKISNIGATGAWLRERQSQSSFAINLGHVTPNGEISDIRIFEVFEFNQQSFLKSVMHAKKARINLDSTWSLDDVNRTLFPSKTVNNERGHAIKTESLTLPQLDWPSKISKEMALAAFFKPDQMKAVDLFQYIRHLDENGQAAQLYEIQFWSRVFYPLSCLVMIVLALPFAYLHFRSGGIATYVFAGVLAGISFFLLNNVFSYIGHLQNLQPWLVAAAPGMIYSMLSLAAFGWLVLKR